MAKWSVEGALYMRMGWRNDPPMAFPQLQEWVSHMAGLNKYLLDKLWRTKAKWGSIEPPQMEKCVGQN